MFKIVLYKIEKGLNFYLVQIPKVNKYYASDRLKFNN